jgi:molybdopterin-guanine dinucleotide biosynthesis protein MobB
VIKHAAKHPAPPDQSHKDTGRYADAGTDIVVGAFEDAAVVRIPSEAVTLERLLTMIVARVDLVIVEGYNETALPPVVV